MSGADEGDIWQTWCLPRESQVLFVISVFLAVSVYFAASRHPPAQVRDLGSEGGLSGLLVASAVPFVEFEWWWKYCRECWTVFMESFDFLWCIRAKNGVWDRHPAAAALNACDNRPHALPWRPIAEESACLAWCSACGWPPDSGTGGSENQGSFFGVAGTRGT